MIINSGKNILKTGCIILAGCIVLSASGCSQIAKIVNKSSSDDKKLEDIMENKKCGDNAEYTLDSSGTLTVSGSGEIYDADDYLHGWAFHKDEIKKIVIESGITSVGDGAFGDCNVEELVLPDTVTHIGDFAFTGCDRLKSADIPKAVKYIGVECFMNCETLESVNIQGSIERIPSAEARKNRRKCFLLLYKPENL